VRLSDVWAVCGAVAGSVMDACEIVAGWLQKRGL
jgi:hypothetical protein